MATSLGMLTGIGGGMMRDVLLTEIPTVLRSELYAVAALVGAVVVVGGHLPRLPIIPGSDSRVCYLLRPPCAGDPVRLAIADRKSSRSTSFAHR
jgi:hypothetical protein